MVYYRTLSETTEWILHKTTKDAFDIIESILFPPNAVFQFKVKTRYVVNGDVIISDDSAVYNLTIPCKLPLFSISRQL